MSIFYDGKLCVYGHGTQRYRAGGACVTCSKDKSKQRWREGTKKKGRYDPVDRRARNLRAHYGLSEADYNTMAESQKHACAVCGGTPTGKYGRFNVDHDHKTGKIRGLLCAKCNVGLGSFDDSSDKLRLATAYLKLHSEG